MYLKIFHFLIFFNSTTLSPLIHYASVTTALTRLWLTSTSMHSLSFLQVADMVSVVPNSKYHSLFFILRSGRGNRDAFWLTHYKIFQLAHEYSAVSYSVISLGCTEHILLLCSAHFESESSWQLVAMSLQRSKHHWCLKVETLAASLARYWTTET